MPGAAVGVVVKDRIVLPFAPEMVEFASVKLAPAGRLLVVWSEIGFVNPYRGTALILIEVLCPAETETVAGDAAKVKLAGGVVCMLRLILLVTPPPVAVTRKE